MSTATGHSLEPYPVSDAEAPVGTRLRVVVRVLKMVGAGFAALIGGSLYLWFQGVRNLPEVKRRKAARRAALLRERAVLHRIGARPSKERFGEPE